MTVQAQDAGKPMLSSTVTVYINVIDENDNAPVFETNSYNVDVYENATVNTVVATVMATDRDSGKHLTRRRSLLRCIILRVCVHGCMCACLYIMYNVCMYVFMFNIVYTTYQVFGGNTCFIIY